MCRWLLCCKQQKGAERNEEAKKHRLGFIVHFQKPPCVPKIGIERIDQGDEQNPQHNQEDLQYAFAQRVASLQRINLAKNCGVYLWPEPAFFPTLAVWSAIRNVWSAAVS